MSVNSFHVSASCYRKLKVVNTLKGQLKITFRRPAFVSSAELQGKEVQLNGQELKPGPNDELPDVKAKPTKSGNIMLFATSIIFFTVVDAGIKT